MTRTIGQLLNEQERNAFVAAARQLLSVRWQHQGRDKRGVDCAGLVVYALKSLGRPVSDAIGYGRLPYRGRLETLVRQNLGDPLPAGAQMQFGDVALMHFVGSALCHCGIITEYPLGGFALLHAFAQNKMVVEHRVDDQWKGYMFEVYRP